MTTLKNKSIKPYSYYQTGGICREICIPGSLDELREMAAAAGKSGADHFVLGGGSNSLISDDEFDGVVFLMSGLGEIQPSVNGLLVGAGVENSALVRFSVDHGLPGLGWMYRLPGQVGGTVRMNARCYGGEISQFATSVTSVDLAGNVHQHTGGKMFRGYKDTVFMSNGQMIAQVEFSLRPGAVLSTREKMAACETDRTAKGQFDWPTCGCVFKNNYAVGVSSGMLLDDAGCKGLRHGNAEVSRHHANFVYNKGASSRQIIELTIMMRERVYRKFGIWLEYEMEVLGNVPADLSEQLQEVRPHQPVESLIMPLREKMAGRI